MKSGIVLIVGRPNTGKSTLVNNLVGQKVAITSPKPQTTRFPVQAVFEDDRGQIIFTDTPGMFEKTPDLLSRKINDSLSQIMETKADLLLYLIDPTRKRDTEENKILGMVRKMNLPKILVINKIDLPQIHESEYAFYEDEFKNIIKVSAFTHANLNLLLDKIFELLPEGNKRFDLSTMAFPTLNLDSKTFIAEIIREKIFLLTYDEIPYSVYTQVIDVVEKPHNVLYVKAKIITTRDQYKKMLIGREGKMIKELGINARKELETASGKKVFLDLSVEVNPHWQETYQG